ncbi:reverse transcriptase domain-containing protein [Tanacetum coccineum]
MLKRCEDTNLSLNWEKSHFMVKEGIVLGHKISKSGIEVDRAKVEDFSKIARPMTHLLEKETPFFFSEECIESFNTLKRKLTEAPILIAPDWDLPFELMCDASDFAIGSPRKEKQHFSTYTLASNRLMNVGSNSFTLRSEKNLLGGVCFEKFRSYLVMSKKACVFTDQSAHMCISLPRRKHKARLHARGLYCFKEF